LESDILFRFQQGLLSTWAIHRLAKGGPPWPHVYKGSQAFHTFTPQHMLADAVSVCNIAEFSFEAQHVCSCNKCAHPAADVYMHLTWPYRCCSCCCKHKTTLPARGNAMPAKAAQFIILMLLCGLLQYTTLLRSLIAEPALQCHTGAPLLNSASKHRKSHC
jgi:hypothetical protein